MEVRRLAGTDLDTSRLVLGTMTFGAQVDEPSATRMVSQAIDAGITMFDTANVYAGGESEAILGRILEPVRDDVQIATKVGARSGPDDGGLSRRAMFESVEASLRRLRTDRIDLLYLHMPDWDVPIQETVEAASELVTSGKVRHVGHSNYAAWQIVEMLQLAGQWQGLRVSQPQYNLVSRLIEDEYGACSGRFGLSNIIYNPLAGGLLTGKHHVEDQPVDGTRFSQAGYRQRYWHPAMFEAVGRLSAVAAGVSLSPIELSYQWLLARPLVTCVIVGASSPEQLATNLGAAGEPEKGLDQETTDLIDGIWATLRGPAPRYNR